MKKKINSLGKFLSKKFQSLHLEYRVAPKPRYGYGKPVHSLLNEIIQKNDVLYQEHLEFFLQHAGALQQIKVQGKEDTETDPVWNNGFLPGLDIVGIYGMLAKYRPEQYIEIGSGNSTKVARKAILENDLKTKITSIDPNPRASIDHLADQVIRLPFEELPDNRFIVDLLGENDVLFIDNSHRVFPNSDAMICFMELLPYLKKGVLVHIHDIYLPFDYPQFMCDRFYNEQYMLAAFILSNPERYKPLLPNYYISEHKVLSECIAPMWNHDHLVHVERHGGSFWIQIN